MKHPESTNTARSENATGFRKALSRQIVGWGLSIAAAMTVSSLIATAAAQERSTTPTSLRVASSATVVAAEIDQLLAAEREAAGLEPTELLDHTRWARRLFFDLVGRPPTPDELLAIELDENFDRQALVETLLADELFGKNWGRYWRDTIFYRKTEERALIVAESTENYLASSINEGKKWSDVATDFIVAQGDGKEDGRNGLIIAQSGRPEETVSEVSRIFLGIQIQCAQCHDHPSDRWTREQFHQLAAFFPRVAARLNPEERTMVVTAQDRFIRRPGGDNMNRFVGTAEHAMPDLDDPQAPGTVMQPVFFVNDRSLPLGSVDAERRSALAEWITDKENEWFAKATVNRMWSELMGRSFYDAVDDIGPDRDAVSVEVLNTLAQGFADSDYDMRWLVRTIVSTDLYARQSIELTAARPEAWVAPYRVPLRSDQLFDRLQSALQFQESEIQAGRRTPGGGLPTPRRGLGDVFGFDPSDPRETWAESIPQSLFLMNGPIVDRMVRGENSLSARLSRDLTDLDTQLDELYAFSLSRMPSATERSTLKQHVAQSSSRREGLEDVHWSLINSSEFLHRD